MVQIQPEPVPKPTRSLNYVFLAEEMLAGLSLDEIASRVLEHLLGAQQALKEDLGSQELSAFYRQVMLECIDERWLDYLTSLEELRYEVRLEGMAHNDPLVVYKSKASQAYGRLLADLRSVSVALMFQPLAADRAVGNLAGQRRGKAGTQTHILEIRIGTMLNIRFETENDLPAIREVNLSAFPTAEEADLVDRLRRHAQPLISLVAEKDRTVLGHILFTPVELQVEFSTRHGPGAYGSAAGISKPGHRFSTGQVRTAGLP